MIIPVILCGGSGTRLWPVSRHHYPKQFHNLTGTRSLFQQTVRRCADATDGNRALFVSSDDYKFLISEQLDAIGISESTIILEPTPRNTAPALALAALSIADADAEAVMLVAPSDHLITDDAVFRDVIGAGAVAAERGYLATLGITPTGPATGYGYIKRETTGKKDLAGNGYGVAEFVEKPDLESATAFVREGTYLWNSGMFLFKAAVFLEEMEKYQPDILETCRQAWARKATHYGFTHVGDEYQEVTSLSVDYAVMEKTQKAVVVPYSGDWNDIGSWSGLAQTRDRDGHGNAVIGNVRLYNVEDSFVFASDRLVTGVGLKNMVVVETKDAVLVSTEKDSQEVKQIVEVLKTEGATEADLHTQVYRPWGSYEDLDEGPGFHVKRLTIKPGASISLQRHFHRAEHWVVVQGQAGVVRGEEEFMLEKNKSTFIPVETVHKLTNLGDDDLVIVEVQTGDYLDESDIERLKDDYGRC